MLLFIEHEVYLWSSFAVGSVNFGRDVMKLRVLESVRSLLLDNVSFAWLHKDK